MTYNMQHFLGTVVLKDYIFMEDGHDYRAFVGIVSILEASKMTGFDVGKNEANWIARIESRDGSRSVNIPGCQVRAVLQGDRFGRVDGARVYYSLD